MEIILYVSKILWNWTRKYSVSAELPAMLTSRQKNFSFNIWRTVFQTLEFYFYFFVNKMNICENGETVLITLEPVV